jgi:hypothetical protein
MDTFTIEARRSWLIRVLGGSPLVRSADRIEAWSYVMAALILAVATPFIVPSGRHCRTAALGHMQTKRCIDT